jgi:hypothetical protein
MSFSIQNPVSQDNLGQKRARSAGSYLPGAALIFVVMSLVWFVQTKSGQDSWNEASRLATIESLVERGTWQIDQSAFTAITGDKLLLDDHFYSEKPPLLQVVSAVPYSIMHHLFGMELRVRPCEAGELCGYKWLTFLIAGLPSALMIALLYLAIARQTHSNLPALLLANLFAFGTMIWPYSLVFNNHIPAAATLFASFLMILAARHAVTAKSRHMMLFGAGLLVALAVSFDLLAIFLACTFFVIVTIRYRGAGLAFIAGGLIPALATMVFDLQISGSLFPPYFSTEGYDYPGSPWSTTVAAMSVPKNIWDYIFRSLVGDQGVLSHSPLLLWPIAGLISVLRNRRHPFRLEAVWLALGLLLYILIVVTRTDNFGGKAYGARFFILLLPLLFYFTAFLPQLEVKTLKGKLIAAILALGILLSVFSAYQGVLNTWDRVRPPLFFQTRAYKPFLTVCSNLNENTCLDAVLDRCSPANVGYFPRQYEAPEMQQVLNANFANRIELLGYDLVERHLRPGEALPVILYWRGLQAMDENLTQFNHLLDQHQVQRGGYDRVPRETYVTTCWQPGEVVADGYTLPIDNDAPDGVYQLDVGLYARRSGQAVPLPLIQDGQPTGVTSAAIGPIQVGDPPPDVVVSQVQPDRVLDADLGGVIRLKGYNLRVEPESLQLDLFWESLAPTNAEYTVFIHLLDQNGVMVSQLDRPPAAGQYPTSLWRPGEIIADSLTLPAPVGPAHQEYSIVAGLYDFHTGTRLKLDTGGADSLQLAPVTFDP